MLPRQGFLLGASIIHDDNPSREVPSNAEDDEAAVLLTYSAPLLMRIL